MTRYRIDAGVALRLIREGVAVPNEHELVGPNLLLILLAFLHG